MVELEKGKAKVLKSQMAKESGLIDLDVQISVDQVKSNNYRANNNSRYETMSFQRYTTPEGNSANVVEQILMSAGEGSETPGGGTVKS
jgi:hypothetical protein